MKNQGNGDILNLYGKGVTNVNGRETGVEVICQHGIDGAIMPIKIRFQDENGEWQSYKIMAYRERRKGEVGTNVPGSIPATATLRRFDCKVQVFGAEKDLVLYYNMNQGTWRLRYA